MALPRLSYAVIAALCATGSGCSAEPRITAATAEVRLLNASYDATRELYADVNAAFARGWELKTGQRVTIEQAHGGSGRQARAVIDGLEADVVTLALAYDIDAIARAGLTAPDWAERLPDGAVPFASSVVFLVRAGNPKAIHDWADLIRDDVEVITPNPKTSGGARWNYLAAWGQAARAPGATPTDAATYAAALLRHVTVFDSGARAATTTFAERGLGDVLIAWDSEARLAIAKLGAGRFELISPPTSIVAEPPVAVVDEVVDRRGSREVATAYLQFLYTPEAQAIAAAHFLDARADLEPTDPATAWFTIDALGGWTEAQHTHFDDGGTFDRLSAR